MQYVEKEYGKDVKVLRKWEKNINKMANHQKPLQILTEVLEKIYITLVSLKLKNNMRTYKTKCIICKEEKALLSE